MRETPSVWNIPPSIPFLAALADALISGELLPGGDPANLARTTILLPTRRAALRLGELLAARAENGAIVLPAIRTLGDIDTDRLVTDEEAGDTGLGRLAGQAALDYLTRPVIAPLERQLALTQMVLAWGNQVGKTLELPNGDAPAAPAHPGEAASLARSLAGLMDSLSIEEIDPAKIRKLADSEFKGYWDVMLDFLAIITGWWPEALVERGAIDQLERRSRIIETYRQRLEDDGKDEPVIAAGSTGSVPATARLLKTIAGLPNGHVVLPGLDTDLDQVSFDAVLADARPHPGHPQYGLAHLLNVFGMGRDDVKTLRESRANGRSREQLFSQIMRPAGMTHLWAGDTTWQSPDVLQTALADTTLMVAANDREEAVAIAAKMREALETPEKRAALVTPDRQLARRVKAELKRWNIDIADSAGIPLSETSAGRLARLIARNVAGRMPPDGVIGMLQHPLCRMGLIDAERYPQARALEILALRGPKPLPWTKGIVQALQKRRADKESDKRIHNNVVRRTVKSDLGAAETLAARLADCLKPLEALGEVNRGLALSKIAQCHLDVFTALIAPAEEGGPDEGAAIRAFLENLAASAPSGLEIGLSDYPALFESLMVGMSQPDESDTHPRLQILGALEARLVDVDMMILGGLNEGVWPAETNLDPFLDRASRAEIGLPAPERRIGLAAHDFVQGACAGEVVLSRAEFSGGKPAIPSRWLQRLGAVIGADNYQALQAKGLPLIDQVRRLDQQTRLPPFPEPRPMPLVEKRPRRISASRVTTWIRDPYSIYASEILKLSPLDPIGEAPGAAERGTFVHDALARYEEGKESCGPDKLRFLLECGDIELKPYEIYPELVAVWRRQFARIAPWFLEWETSRGIAIAKTLFEEKAVTTITTNGKDYELSAIADRIDLTEDGELHILDYKTGTAPSGSQVQSGLEPQLTLEAAMAMRGAWKKIPHGKSVGALTYLQLSGGHPAGLIKAITPEKKSEKTLDDLADDAMAGLIKTIEAFDDQNQPYLVKPRVQFQLRYDDYDHLSRYGEWSVVDAADNSGGGE